MSTPPPSNISIAVPRNLVRRVGYTLATLLVVGVIALVVIALSRVLTPTDPLQAGVESNRYQAVFLANSEVYFGKLSFPGNGYCYLKHVYRLTQQTSPKTGQPKGRTLVRVVNDVHGPEDMMIISRSQINYVENLNPAGKAAQLLQSSP